MDLRKLKTILELFENSAIDELELAEGEERIRLSKRTGTASARSAAEPGSAAANPGQLVLPEDAPAAGSLPEESAGEQSDSNVFTSPMVGTFYAAPAPDKSPFVAVGDTVAEGDVVCIVEAMKLMNEIRAPFSGRILAVHARNGEAIAFGDKLMTIG